MCSEETVQLNILLHSILRMSLAIRTDSIGMMNLDRRSL